MDMKIFSSAREFRSIIRAHKNQSQRGNRGGGEFAPFPAIALVIALLCFFPPASSSSSSPLVPSTTATTCMRPLRDAAAWVPPSPTSPPPLSALFSSSSSSSLSSSFSSLVASRKLLASPRPPSQLPKRHLVASSIASSSPYSFSSYFSVSSIVRPFRFQSLYALGATNGGGDGNDDVNDAYRDQREGEDDDDDDDDDDDENDDDDGGSGDEKVRGDWRAFRARLVNMELRESKGLAHPAQGTHVEEDGLINETERTVLEGNSSGARRASFASPSSSSFSSSSASVRSSSDLWAYDVIDSPVSALHPGSLLLYRPLPPGATAGFYGYGLGRQYLHKSVVLVQEVIQGEFVTGVLLNRGPYGDKWGLRWGGKDSADNDDDNDDGWDVWFGGDARSLVDDEGFVEGGPVFYCLHGIEGCREVDKVSMERFPGVKFTTPTNARGLVKAGLAKPSDFWTFCGYLHWTADQIRDEISDGLWHVVETDPGALFRELSNRRHRRLPKEGVATKATNDDDVNRFDRHYYDDGNDKKYDDDYQNAKSDVGIGLWDDLMEMILRRDECVVECEVEDIDDGIDHAFDDAMLREWMEERLLRPPTPDALSSPPSSPPQSQSTSAAATRLPPRSISPPTSGVTVREGDVVRALCPASEAPSPFLLSDHELHKSLILITQNDGAFTVGVLLNIPSARTVEMQVAAGSASGDGDDDDYYYSSLSSSSSLTAPSSFFFRQNRRPVTVGKVPVRYGGPYDFVGTDDVPLFFLHRRQELADAGLGGERIGNGDIFRCTLEEATDAIRRGFLSENELVAVNGFCVWEKVEEEVGGGIHRSRGGMEEQILDGRFETVPAENLNDVWDMLLKQSLLSPDSVDTNLRLSNAAWNVAGAAGSTDARTEGSGRPRWGMTARRGRNERRRMERVGRHVSSLADDATRRWIEGFLLGDAPFRKSNAISE